jgi:hypothetical protein
MSLMYPEDVDQRLNWPLGRSERLARQRRLPYVLLPDGSIRFEAGAIEELVHRVPASVPASQPTAKASFTGDAQ